MSPPKNFKFRQISFVCTGLCRLCSPLSKRTVEWGEQVSPTKFDVELVLSYCASFLLFVPSFLLYPFPSYQTLTLQGVVNVFTSPLPAHLKINLHTFCMRFSLHQSKFLERFVNITFQITFPYLRTIYLDHSSILRYCTIVSTIGVSDKKKKMTTSGISVTPLSVDLQYYELLKLCAWLILY